MSDTTPHLPRRGHSLLQVCQNEQIALWGGAAALWAETGGEDLAVRRLRSLWLRGQLLLSAPGEADGLCLLPVTAQCKRRMSRSVSWSQSGTERGIPGKGLPAVIGSFSDGAVVAETLPPALVTPCELLQDPGP